MRRLLAAFFLLLATSFAQQNCEVRAYPEYDAKIKEFTTEKFFLTELVDHLPLSTCVPPPDKHLGHVVGAPNVLTHTEKIYAYMRKLDEASPRVVVREIGKSEEGRPMLVVFISDEENLKNLDRYRQITARLSDPRGVTEDEARKLIAEGKPMYWAATGIHSPETGGPEMFMELAYRLAVEESEFIQKIRRDSIVMLTPVVEPDGRDRMVDVYNYRKKNPDQANYPLVWWGHYVAHDNNRDGMTLSLALSRNMMKTFLDYHPQVFHDLHESIPYLYISTGTGPYNAWLDPITTSEWQQLAHHEVNEMTKRGVIGVWTHGFYDGWAPNYMFYLANGHNSIGRFYETFGNGGADTRVRTLQPNSTSREWYRQNPPLPKVRYSQRNNTNLAQSALLIGLHNVASNGARFLENFYLKSQRSVAKAKNEGPAAWVFPADDPRPVEQARLLNLLRMQGVEIHRLEKDYTVPVKKEGATEAKDEKKEEKKPEAEEKKDKPAEAAAPSEAAKDTKPAEAKKEEKPAPQTFPAGSYVVRMDQPYSRMADMMLDTQYYSPKDPRSYDDTGWTLGALRNVKTARLVETAILEAPMQKLGGDIAVKGAVSGSGPTYVINHNTDNTLATLRFRLGHIDMLAAEKAFELDGKKFKAGSFIIRTPAERKERPGRGSQPLPFRDTLEQAAVELGLQVHATNSEIKVATHKLAAPRIALLQSWESTQNDGWYRIAMDGLKVPYKYVPDTQVRSIADLRAQFDVIILPPWGFGSLDLSDVINGIPKRGKPMPWKNTEEYKHLVAPGLNSADDIRGGLGYDGLTKLQKFVADGGLLIAITTSAAVPVQSGMTEMVSITDARQLQAPGSVVLAKVDDAASPITYGYDDKLYVYFRQGPVFRVSATSGFGFGAGQGEQAARGSGRGSTTDPDIPQARPRFEPEKPPKRTPREQELYLPEDISPAARASLPPQEQWPRVVLRFAPEKELLLSGMMVGANEVAEKPAVIDIPHGKGHVVLFANNPMWRDETMGSFFLLFNAMLNFEHLNVGREAAKAPPAEEKKAF